MAIFLIPHTIKHANKESEGTFTSYKIHQALAKRLQRRGTIMSRGQICNMSVWQVIVWELLLTGKAERLNSNYCSCRWQSFRMAKTSVI